MKKIALLLGATVLMPIFLTPLNASDLETQRLQIEADEFRFVLSHPFLERGRPVELILVNRGTLPHEFASTLFEGGLTEVESDGVVVEGRGIEEIELPPGKMVKVSFVPRKKGVIPFVCDLPGHEEKGMKGSLLIR